MCRDTDCMVSEDSSELLFYLFCFRAHLHYMLVRRDEILCISRTLPVAGKCCNFRVQEIEGKGLNFFSVPRNLACLEIEVEITNSKEI